MRCIHSLAKMHTKKKKCMKFKRLHQPLLLQPWLHPCSQTLPMPLSLTLNRSYTPIPRPCPSAHVPPPSPSPVATPLFPDWTVATPLFPDPGHVPPPTVFAVIDSNHLRYSRWHWQARGAKFTAGATLFYSDIFLNLFMWNSLRLFSPIRKMCDICP